MQSWPRSESISHKRTASPNFQPPAYLYLWGYCPNLLTEFPEHSGGWPGSFPIGRLVRPGSQYEIPVLS